MVYRKIVGTSIRRHRLLKEWTQEQLAGKTGLSYEYVNRLENGRVNVGIDNLVKIAKALGVRPSQLLEPEGWKQIQPKKED